MFNKPNKPAPRSAPSNRIVRLLFFVMLVQLVVFWLFPDLGFVSRMISLFVSLIFIALVVLVVFPDWIERLLTSQQQNQPDLENRQQDDEP